MEDNPKDHDIGGIIESLKEFGFVSPGVRNETTSRTAAGHGRARGLAEMQRTGMDRPRRVLLDDDGEWLVPIVAGVSFDSDEQALAYCIADNRHTIRGGWDLPKLHAGLASLYHGDGLTGTGYDDQDLDDLSTMLGLGDGAQSGENGGSGAPGDGDGQAQGDGAADRETLFSELLEAAAAMIAAYDGKGETELSAITRLEAVVKKIRKRGV